MNPACALSSRAKSVKKLGAGFPSAVTAPGVRIFLPFIVARTALDLGPAQLLRRDSMLEAVDARVRGAHGAVEGGAAEEGGCGPDLSLVSRAVWSGQERGCASKTRRKGHMGGGERRRGMGV